KDQVFGIIGNVGTPTAVVAVPYALERRMLFFGAFTGANVLRHDPPDRYVFNYRASYAEETDAAVNQLKLQKPPIKAVVMVATYRAAAKFIERTHDLFPGMIYTNVSFVGSTALADELMLLGPRYASGVIVTQVVPAVSGYSSAVLEYKNALAKYFPGEAPDYVSLEGY